jgi:phosphatidylserine decarboxylase
MKDKINYIGYAPEAIILSLICFVLFLYLKRKWACVFVIVIFSVLLAFYRGRNWHLGVLAVPDMNTPPDNMLLSPCDGKVLRIVRHEDAFQIAIFLNVHNVHVQYVPISGRITSIIRKDGEFVPAYMFDKSQYNERVETVIESKMGNIKIVQIAGLLARRILSFHKENAHVLRGEPLGLIKFGSRVDLWIPLSSMPQILVKEGERVHIGSNIAILQSGNLLI